VYSSPLDPDILGNGLAFLDLYVGEQLPDPGRIAPIAPIIYSMILDAGAPTPPLPADRFDGITDLGAARALFESDPHVRVLMENGAGSPIPRLPAPRFELGFDRWPPREVRATAWYLGPNGTLLPKRPRGDAEGIDAFHPDPDARPAQTLPGQGQSQSWAVLPAYDWRPLVAGTA